MLIFSAGCALARRHSVKYIETSPGMFRWLSSGVCHVVVAGINHNIDELLVGVVKQVRLREVKEKRKKKTKVNLRQEPVAIFSNLIFCSRCGENFLEKFWTSKQTRASHAVIWLWFRERTGGQEKGNYRGNKMKWIGRSESVKPVIN